MTSVESPLDTRPRFSKALDDELAQWSLAAGITVEVWALPKTELPGGITELVHAVIRDVLAEIEQHGQARTVSIALTVAASGLRLTISDDGAGMPVAAIRERIGAKRARLVKLGGELTINGVPGEGTTVSAVIPRKGLMSRR
jgi:signal transduction histidine kinase